MFSTGVAAHRKRVFADTDTTGQVAEVSRVIARLPGIGMSVGEVY